MPSTPHTRWSSPSVNEFDIYVDVDGDGVDDYIVVGVDQGAVQPGTFNGTFGSFVFSTRSSGADILFLADAPTNGSTAVMYVTADMLCRSGEPCLDGETNRRISYRTLAFDLNSGDSFTVPGRAKYNVWASAVQPGRLRGRGPGRNRLERLHHHGFDRMAR